MAKLQPTRQTCPVFNDYPLFEGQIHREVTGKVNEVNKPHQADYKDKTI